MPESDVEKRLSMEQIVRVAEQKRALLVQKETTLQHCFIMLQSQIAKAAHQRRSLMQQGKEIAQEKNELKRLAEQQKGKERALKVQSAELESQKAELDILKMNVNETQKSFQVKTDLSYEIDTDL